MSRLVVRAVASLISATFVMILVDSWEPAQFAISVTIRSIARFYFPYLELQVVGLALATVLLGQAVQAFSAGVAGAAAWREKWLWTSLLIATVCGAVLALVDALRRDLGIRGGLFEALWAATSLGVVAFVSLVAYSSLERVGTAWWHSMRRRV